MKSRRLSLMLVIALGASIMLGSSPAGAGDPIATWAPTGPPVIAYGPFHVYPVDNSQCTIDLGLWAKEHGKSGIVRFAFEVQLRGTYDPGNIYLPTYYESGYWWGPDSPDDERDFITTFTLGRDWVYVAADSTPTVWVKIVGERPSLWDTDEVMMAKFGRPACESGSVSAVM